MSKQEKIQEINKLLNVYNIEQLNLLKEIMYLFSFKLTKGNLMKLLYSKDQKIDTSIPLDFSEKMKSLISNFNSFHYVVDYNNNHLGDIRNVSDDFLIKLCTVLDHCHFEKHFDK